MRTLIVSVRTAVFVFDFLFAMFRLYLRRPHLYAAYLHAQPLNTLPILYPPPPLRAYRSQRVSRCHLLYGS